MRSRFIEPSVCVHEAKAASSRPDRDLLTGSLERRWKEGLTRTHLVLHAISLSRSSFSRRHNTFVSVW